MKKLGVMTVALVLVLALSGAASAASYGFLDFVWAGEEIPNDPVTYEYQHDISDDVNFAAGDQVTDAYLWLGFNCGYDDELTYIQFDDEGWHPIDDLNNNWWGLLTIDVDWLNDDGLLNVALQYQNSGDTPLPILYSSVLGGWAQTESASHAPVPEPATMILLGVGLVGVGVPGRKKIFKNK